MDREREVNGEWTLIAFLNEPPHDDYDMNVG